MSKKRKSSREFKTSAKKQSSPRKSNEERYSQLVNLVLGLLYETNSGQRLSQLYKNIAGGRYGENDLSAAIDLLLKAGLIIRDNKNRLRLHQHTLLCEGRLSQHPRGFGFIKVTKCSGNKPALTRDPFVAPHQMAGAHHGDLVLIRILRIRGDDRPECSVVKILAPGSNTLGGIYRKEGRNRLVYPDDHRFPFIIRIIGSGGLQPADGDGVIARFDRAEGSGNIFPGEIVEILGAADDVQTQMRLVIEQFQLPWQFDDEVRQQTREIAESFALAQDREDLRQTAHITIDGEHAQDFDDAICVAKTRNGFRLFVSIADVSHFVAEGSAIDQEAYRRGTSVYFPGRVVPMLPERLSNDLCSLVPGEDRYTVSAILDFDRQGALLKRRFCRSIICSRHRFTYTTIRRILVDKEPAVRKEHKPFLTMLKWAGELALALQSRRRKGGSIDFNLVETEFLLTDTGKIAAIHQADRNFAHQIIEEFMLAANQAVATLLFDHKIPAIYRVHEPPDVQKAEDFFEFVKSLGISLPPFANTSTWFSAVLNRCQGSRYEYLINNLLLRTMKQARYSTDNIGHFGLATNNYTHFTSPIRRYPDLVVHRQLLQLLERTDTSRQSASEAAEFLSNRERTAVMAERDMNDRLKAGYMQHRIGDIFEAIISGVADNGLYIEIPDICISGSIPIEELGDDYFMIDKKNHRLVGEISARTYQIGDQVRVTVVDVDLLSKRILFALVQ